MADTSIRISEELADRLYELKNRGDSYEDVIWRLLWDSQDEDDRAKYDIEADPNQLPDDLDLPGTGETLQRRREAIARMYEYIKQEHGGVEKSEFLKLIEPDRVGYESAESFWANCVKGKDTLSSLPGVDPPAEGGRKWGWIIPPNQSEE